MDDDYRPVIWGMNGNTPWSNLLPETGLDGLGADPKTWRREGDVLIGDVAEGSAVLKFGSADWKDYEISFAVTVLRGANLDVGVRVADKKAYVFKFLLGWQACAVTLRDFDAGTLDHLSVVNHRLEQGREYHVEIDVRGRSITTYMDGKLVNQVTDRTNSQGGAYLEVWQSALTFHTIRYRRIN